MPTFNFRCAKCGHAFEGKIPFGSSDYPACPACNGKSEKLLTPPMGIMFKGSGFYKTDSTVTKQHTAKKPEEEKASVPETVKPKEKTGIQDAQKS